MDDQLTIAVIDYAMVETPVLTPHSTGGENIATFDVARAEWDRYLAARAEYAAALTALNVP